MGVSDLYQVAWWSVHVTSKPENIHKAVNASLEVLRNIATMRIMPYELERAKVTVLTKHDADTKVGRLLPRCLADPLGAVAVLVGQCFCMMQIVLAMTCGSLCFIGNSSAGADVQGTIHLARQAHVHEDATDRAYSLRGHLVSVCACMPFHCSNACRLLLC